MRALLDFVRRHIILSILVIGLVKFCVGLVIGFGLGVYFLPILTAEQGLSAEELAALQKSHGVTPQAKQEATQVKPVSSTTSDTPPLRKGVFDPEHPASDFAHWGDGEIYVTDQQIWLDGKISPGPDYRLYLTKGQVTGVDDFLSRKSESAQIAPIKAYENFIVPVPDGVNVADYDAVLIWCEAFSAFIASAAIK